MLQQPENIENTTVILRILAMIDFYIIFIGALARDAPRAAQSHPSGGIQIVFWLANCISNWRPARRQIDMFQWFIYETFP